MIVELPRRSREDTPVRVEVEPVPTADDLVRMSAGAGPIYAEPAKRGIRVTAAGHELMGDIMRRNAAAVRAANEARPPIIEAPPMSAAQQAHLWALQAFAD